MCVTAGSAGGSPAGADNCPNGRIIGAVQPAARRRFVHAATRLNFVFRGSLVKGPSLEILLSERKSGLVSKWLDQMLLTYPESSANYLSGQQDQFRNPVGYRLKEGLSILFDSLAKPERADAAKTALESIIKLRAVQDISAGQAVAFIFLLKRTLRVEFDSEIARFPDEFAALDLRFDELALLAFDLFVKCREQIYEIKMNECKRMALELPAARRQQLSD
jgi:hypothetical protein